MRFFPIFAVPIFALQVFDECRANGHAWTNGRDAKWLSGNKWPGIVKEVKDRADKNRYASFP